jgi:Domain of unknown function (DUF1707)
MATDPRIRASDDDRDRTATLLREHHAAGQLTPEEFNERLDKTFAAKTMGDLDGLLSDLPGIDLYRLPGHGLSRGQTPGNSSALAAMASSGMASRPHGRLSPAWGAAWGSWLTLSTVLVVIWAIGGMGYPWFAWIAGPWGALMLARWISGGHPGGDGHSGHQHGGHQHGDRNDRHRRHELPGDED